MTDIGKQELSMLADLGQSWHVALTNAPIATNVPAMEWILTIVDINDARHAFAYTGVNLPRMIRAAWAGLPTGRV